jgi:hypothetical protein
MAELSKNFMLLLFGTIIILAGAVIVVCLACGIIPVPSDHPIQLWMAGAAALGLLTGFTTGASADLGSGKEYVKFVGTGILVPIFGAVGTLLERTQKVTENSTYSGAQLVEKITTTLTPLAEGSLTPLTALGSFFVAFALFALLGIVGGVLLRIGGFEVRKS